MYIIVLLIFFVSTIDNCSLSSLGWGHVHLQCRDNDNGPLDWWYIYKPPTDVVPFLNSGLNFSYLTPDSPGRWEPSDKHIASSAMLQHTLAPIFRPTYVDHLAVAIYDDYETTDSFAGTKARGVLIADEIGGVWIYHTVPGLINLKRDRPSFPENESANGHLLMCISLDLDTINAIFRGLRFVYPKLTYFTKPERLKNILTEWQFINSPLTTKKIKNYQFTTSDKSLSVEVFLKTPGNKQSLYKAFASSKDIVLDVYGHTEAEYITKICGEKYSVRNIETISLKCPENIMYIDKQADKMRFAVSTAAHWQKLGQGYPQYWSCVSNLDKEDVSGIGGDLLCVENYMVWLAFDNFKVKEPEC